MFLVVVESAFWTNAFAREYKLASKSPPSSFRRIIGISSSSITAVSSSSSPLAPLSRVLSLSLSFSLSLKVKRARVKGASFRSLFFSSSHLHLHHLDDGGVFFGVVGPLGLLRRAADRSLLSRWCVLFFKAAFFFGTPKGVVVVVQSRVVVLLMK